MKRIFAILLTAALLLTSVSALADYYVGQIVTFGHYEQDNNYYNGKEPIEWIVTKVEGSQVTLVSTKVIDARGFASSWAAFGSSNIKKWLNGNFMSDAFSAEEIRKMIIQPTYKVYVSLPSYQEANNTLQWLGVVACQATPYAIAHGVETDWMGNAGWWVREHSRYKCSYINAEGNIQAGGVWPSPNTPLGVRPMIVIRSW